MYQVFGSSCDRLHRAAARRAREPADEELARARRDQRRRGVGRAGHGLRIGAVDDELHRRGAAARERRTRSAAGSTSATRALPERSARSISS